MLYETVVKEIVELSFPEDTECRELTLWKSGGMCW